MTDDSADARGARTDDWRRTWHAVRDVLGSKWAFHVLRALADDERGFNELKRELAGVTAKTLSERLGELRCAGFVEREVHATSPPATTYRLTDHGESLAAALADVESLVAVAECPDGGPRGAPESSSEECPLDGDCPVPAAAGDVCGPDAVRDADCACEP